MNIRHTSFTFRALALAIAFALVASLRFVAFSATASPPPKLIKLPNGDYTVPMRELAGSGVNGTATFHREGLRTLVTITTYGFGKGKHAYDLHPGSSCSQLGVAGARNLQPALTGIPSQTLVNLPLSDISSHYVVAASNANEQNARHEACGHF